MQAEPCKQRQHPMYNKKRQQFFFFFFFVLVASCCFVSWHSIEITGSFTISSLLISYLKMSSIAIIISSAQGFPLSRTCSTTTHRPRWQSISRLVAFMMEIFPGKEDFQFSAGLSTYYSNIQSLDVGKSCFFVTVVSTLLSSLVEHHACGRHHDSVHFYSLARYIGVVTLLLFETMMRRCSIFLESTMLHLISNSTYRDTLQDHDGDHDEEDDDGLDPMVRQTFEELPDLADALVMYEEHFLQPLIQSTVVLIDGRESFLPHWFDAVIHYYVQRKNPLHDSSECICSLHLIKSEATVSINKTGSGNSNGKGQSHQENSTNSNQKSSGAVLPSLLKMASISSSGSLVRENSAVWDRDISTFAGVMIQKLGDSLCKENECLDDSNCRVLLRLQENIAGKAIQGELLVISLLTAGENTLVLSASVSMDTEGILNHPTTIHVDSPALVAVLEKHTHVGPDNDKHSLLLFTANVLHTEFREVWKMARKAVAAAFFCNGQGATPANYKAALDATTVRATKTQQTVPTAAAVDAVEENGQQAAPTLVAVDVMTESIPLAVPTPKMTTITAVEMTTPTSSLVLTSPMQKEAERVVADTDTGTGTIITATPHDLAVAEDPPTIETRKADEVEYIPCPPSVPPSSFTPAFGGPENSSRPSSSHSAKRPGRTLKLSDKT